MKSIRYTETLFYYDGPQVFVARDSIGGHYIAVAVEGDGGEDKYLLAGVAPERLWQFRAGFLDLRKLILEGEDGEWFIATAPQGLEEPLVAIRQDGRLEDSGLLPEDGFVLSPAETAGSGAHSEVKVVDLSHLHSLDYLNLDAESLGVEIEGALQKADLESGFWQLDTMSGSIIGNVIEGGSPLKGLKLGNKYRFQCVSKPSRPGYKTGEAMISGGHFRSSHLTADNLLYLVNRQQVEPQPA